MSSSLEARFVVTEPYERVDVHLSDNRFPVIYIGGTQNHPAVVIQVDTMALTTEQQADWLRGLSFKVGQLARMVERAAANA